MKLSMKQKQIHRHREQAGGCQGGGGGRGLDWESGVSRRKLVIYGKDKQQRPTAQRRELYSISCDKP